MKKLLAIVMTLFLILGTVSAMAETTHLVFWHSMSEKAGECMEKYVADFNATIGAEAGIEVEAVYQGSYSEATQKLNSILSSNRTADLPDMMQLDATGKVAYFTSGCAYTVDQALADHPEDSTADLLAAALGNWNYAGVQLGLPFATSTTVMFYNKTLLDAAGMEAPQTFADIIKVSEALKAENRVIYSTVPNTPTLANWIGQVGSYVVNNKNGSEGTASELACIDNGALAAFLTEWKAMYTAGALKNVAGSSDEFVAGNLVLMTGSSSSIASNLARIGGAFEMGVANYPKVNEDASFGATVSGSCLVMFEGEKKDAAWTFVKYLTSGDVQADFGAATGYIPSNARSLESEVWQKLVSENPVYMVGVDQLSKTPADMRSVTVGPSADFYYGIQNCVSDMLDSDLSVEETVEIMADELGGLLTQYVRANP